MITVGKILRKTDKETICREVVASKGFEKRKEEAKKELYEIIKRIGLEKIQKEIECSSVGAVKLCETPNFCSACVFLYDKEFPETTSEWYDTAIYLPQFCSEFTSGHRRVFIAKTERMKALIEIITTETNAKRTAERDVSALLDSFGSSKALLELLPEFKKFVKIENSGSTSLIPMSTVLNVKELLK